MLFMSKEETLARVDADLARGHTFRAAQRLASLTAIHPDDLEVRTRRFDVNHRIGNFVEAGRWGYLTEEVDPHDIAAFERAFKRAWDQLRALKLRSDPTPHLGPSARARLEALARRAAEEGPAPAAWTQLGPAPARGVWGQMVGFGCGAIVVLSVLALFSLAVYGLLALINIV